MQTLRRLAEIKAKIDEAFHLLRRRTQVYDYGQKFRFKILDQDHDTAFEMSDVPVSELVDDSYLTDMIEAARAHIEARRHRLNLGPRSTLLSEQKGDASNPASSRLAGRTAGLSADPT